MRQKIVLLRQEPFFGVMMCRLNIVRDDVGHKTMATNGKTLWWNDKYVSGMNDVKLTGLLAHEIMHVVRLHMTRMGTRDGKKWNYACDATIDHDLKDAGFDVPDTFADMPEWAWAKGMTAEAIYELIPDPPPDEEPRGGGVEPAPGASGEGQASPAEAANIEVDIKIAIQHAALAQQAAEASGKYKGVSPAWMKQLIEDIVHPKVPWEDLLRAFVSNRVPSGLTWARPNRKFIHKRTYLPGRLKEGLGELVIYTDTSGSVRHFQSQFYAEIKKIVEDLNPERVVILHCDAAVGALITCEPGDFVEPSYVGGGGSDFRPAFKRIEDEDIRPCCAIVLSDMDIDFPKTPPNYPVLGISTTPDKSGPDWMQTVWIS